MHKNSELTTQNSELVPTHIGLILDGNRRWAIANNKKTLEGHKEGAEVFKSISIALFEKGVKFVSGYVFSTENWNRTEEEVSYLMKLLVRAVELHLDVYHQKNVKILLLGSRDGLSNSVLKSIEKTESKTANNSGGTLAICFNYGGRQELVDATKSIIEQNIKSSEITEQTIAQNLYNPEVPDIDLLIRTSGEQRLSGFMLWRASYSELSFIEKLWPDVTIEDIEKVLKQYMYRERRFGK
jgi:undecaprenyl diphosphate synthase